MGRGARAGAVLRSLWFWIAIGLLLTGVAVFWGRPGKPVDVIVARRQEVVQQVVGTGRAAWPSRVHMGSQTLGIVRKVAIHEGDSVESGAILVEFEDGEARAAVKGAEASLEQARARLSQLTQVGARVAREAAREAELRLREAETTLEREKNLFESHVSTAEAVEKATNAVATARSRYDSSLAQVSSTGGNGAEMRQAMAAVAQAEAGVASARARLSLLRLTAPAAGLILSRDVEPGDVVQPGHPLVVFAPKGNPVVTAEIEEKNLGLLRLDQTARVVADAYPDQVFEARLASISPEVNATRGTVTIRLQVASPPPFLRSDMSVSVTLEVGRRSDAWVLPVSAIRDLASSAPWVLVVNGAKLEKRPVHLGFRGEGVVEITSGLVGDEKVAAIAAGLEPLMRVRPQEREGAKL